MCARCTCTSVAVAPFKVYSASTHRPIKRFCFSDDDDDDDENDSHFSLHVRPPHSMSLKRHDSGQETFGFEDEETPHGFGSAPSGARTRVRVLGSSV